MADLLGIMVRAQSGIGVLHQLTGVIAQHRGNILSVEIVEERPPESRIYFEVEISDDPAPIVAGLAGLNVVQKGGDR